MITNGRKIYVCIGRHGSIVDYPCIKRYCYCNKYKNQVYQRWEKFGKIRNTYEEIVSELLSEREEAIRIAQAYKIELDRIIISDKDIEHLHNTVSRVLEIIKAFQLISATTKGEEEIQKINEQTKSYEQIKELISVDTLKTMQLLGFNYKAAIGEPLTQICAKAITSFGDKKNSTPIKRK